MEHEFLIDDQTRIVLLEEKNGRCSCRIGERGFDAEIVRIGENELSILIEGRAHRVMICREGDRRHIHLHGRQLIIQEPSREDADFSGADHTGEEKLLILSPMPGKVIKIDVAEGDPVRKNQTLCVVEAMKMENEIKSSIEGSVKKIYAAPGDLIDPDAVLIELERKTDE